MDVESTPIASLQSTLAERVAAAVARVHPDAGAFSEFYEACPVLKAPSEEARDNRVLLCRVTGDTLRLGLRLLGIATPERL